MKIGDVFCVPIDGHTNKYFQYVAKDPSQLNSPVIKAFKESYPIHEKPRLGDVVKGSVDFVAHVMVQWGVKMGLWEKAGSVRDVGKLTVIFRDTDDCVRKLGEERVLISRNWYVWRLGGEFKRVGELGEEYQNSEIGVIVAPAEIVHRMRKGEYSFVYPGF